MQKDLELLTIQKMTREMDEEEKETADYTFAYDAQIIKAKEVLTELNEVMERLNSEELVDDVEVAIAEEFMLIPKNTTWEDYSERLTKTALNIIRGKIPEALKHEDNK